MWCCCVHVFPCSHPHTRGKRVEREMTAIREESEGERERARASKEVVDVCVSCERGPRGYDAQGRDGGRRKCGVLMCEGCERGVDVCGL